MKFIDIPQPRTLDQYNSAIDEMTDRIRNHQGVVSIYQIGSVSNPGLSDIDMLVVFEDDANVQVDPVRDFPSDTYLFTHQIYGVPKQYWNELRSLTFFHNYRLVEGEELPEIIPELYENEIQNLKRQIALEFLIKMYIVLSVQLRYDIVKLRSFLLEGKALIYDLEFLGIDHGEMHDLVQSVIKARADWWNNRPSDKEMELLIKELFIELTKLLELELSKSPLFMPTEESFQLSRNIHISNGQLGSNSSGITVPNFGFFNERKHFNLLNRLNKFNVLIPYRKPEVNSAIDKRFRLLSELRSYNNKNLPGFLIPASSLKVI